MNNDIVLHASGITKYFHDPETFKVLDDIHLEVQRGEFLSLIGKSGCGKSTLLYVLSTMDSDYEGKLNIDHTLLTGMSQNQLSSFRNKHIGFVFQFHFLLPEFTALENVMIPARKLGQYGKDEIEHRAMEKLRMLDMHTYALKNTQKLSGGQQQRVAIARSLINDPTIIMGDEPTGNLDTYNTSLVFDIFRNISRELNQTIITVTHDRDFALKCDRVIEMKDGRVVKG
jgi:lipoprotein-releasing system ATP-binding protein